MTTTPTRPSKPGKQWTRLETPQVALVLVALVSVDLLVAAVMLFVIGDASCEGLACRLDGVSTARPLVALALAVVTTAVPVGLAWRRRQGLRTVLVVQIVAGALLITWAAGAVGAARAARSAAPPVPVVPSLRPCAAKTPAGVTCLTYAPQTPGATTAPTASPSAAPTASPSAAPTTGATLTATSTSTP